MSQMLDAALAYAKLGFPVFPCNEVKVPLTARGCLDATTDPALIAKMWHGQANANIGMHVGAANMMVVDLDTGHDLEEANRIFEGLPVTLLKSRTPSGGEHLFYALNEGERVAQSASKLTPNVDIRSWHSYVLLPPSRTIDSYAATGKRRSTAGSYEWAHEADNWPVPMPKPAHRTDAMVRVAGAPRAKSTAAQEWIIEPDLPANILLAETYIGSADCKPAIMGAGGDDMTYKTAGMMRSYGLSEEMATEIMLRFYNLKCVPPWQPDEIALPIRNAYRYATSEPGNMTPAFREEQLQSLLRAAKALRSARTGQDGGSQLREGLYNGMEFASRPPTSWIIEGWIEQSSYSIASARSQAGKTFNELALALSIATGRPWHGKEVAVSGPVVYVGSEGFSRIQLDVEAWLQFYGLESAALKDRFFSFDGTTRLNTPEGFATLAEIMEDVHAITGRYPSYLVLDTLRRNMRGGVSQEEPTSDVLTAVDEIRRRYSVAVTLVAHHGRTHEESKGLTDWEDDADQVRHYSGNVRDNSTVLEFSKIKRGEDGHKLKIRYQKVELPDGQCTLVATATGADPVPEPEAAATKLPPLPLMDYDAKAIEILQAEGGTGLSRADLTTAVVAAMTPELSEMPKLRSRFYTVYYTHLRRLGKQSPLSAYVHEDDRNDKAEPVHFCNPDGGRRLRKSATSHTLH